MTTHTGYNRIVRLDEAVVNKIAAGEVIIRPSSAIKELVENCLDAGSTSVTVVIRGGGLKLIQIQDNGCGIGKDDLPIVCQRFTTSKLARFEELRSIKTFGFRGEALASISHVARVSIVTAQEGDEFAYKSHYVDGKLAPPPGSPPGASSDPKPCAGVKGTQINVEDLFYGMMVRRKALGSENDEYGRIRDVLGKYSIRNPHVAFTCKKYGANVPDLHTIGGSSSTQDNIRIVYGANVAKELIPIVPLGASEGEGDSPSITWSGFVSNANYSMKKGIYIFFINSRLVVCHPLKKALDAVYGPILPRHAHPFIFLDLTLPAANVDVNVHPTKQEVRFLNEDKVISGIQMSLKKALEGANESRTFAVQPMQVQSVLRLDLQSDNDFVEHDRREGGDGDDHDQSQREREELRGIGIERARPAATSTLTSSVSRNSDETPLTSWSSSNFNFGDTTRPRNSNSNNSNRNRSTVPSTSASRPNKRVRTEIQAGDMDKYVLGGTGVGMGVERDRVRAQAQAQPTKTKQVQPRSSDVAMVIDDGEADDVVSDSQGQALTPSLTQALSTPGARLLSTTVSSGSRFSGIQSQLPLAQHTISQSSALALHSHSQSQSSSASQLTSIKELIAEFERASDATATAVMKESTFVGPVNTQYSMIQHGTRLMMLNLKSAMKEMCYQLILRQFSAMKSLVLSHAPSIVDLMSMALELETEIESSGPTPGDQGHTQRQSDAAEIVQCLGRWREMLNEYFAIEISDDGRMNTLPLVIPDPSVAVSTDSSHPYPHTHTSASASTHTRTRTHIHYPAPSAMPEFIRALCFDIDWSNERNCLEGIARALATLYATLTIECLGIDGDGDGDGGEGRQKDMWREHVSTLLLPCLKRFCSIPGTWLSDGTIVQLASTEELYRVFERC